MKRLADELPFLYIFMANLVQALNFTTIYPARAIDFQRGNESNSKRCLSRLRVLKSYTTYGSPLLSIISLSVGVKVMQRNRKTEPNYCYINLQSTVQAEMPKLPKYSLSGDY